MYLNMLGHCLHGSACMIYASLHDLRSLIGHDIHAETAISVASMGESLLSKNMLLPFL